MLAGDRRFQRTSLTLRKRPPSITWPWVTVVAREQAVRDLLRSRAGHIILRYDFSPFFWKICLFRRRYTVCSIIGAYETRLKENGISYPPNQTCKVFAVHLRISLCSLPIFFQPRVDHQKVRLVLASRKPTRYACILVILQPLTRITTLRRSCFTVR